VSFWRAGDRPCQSAISSIRQEEAARQPVRSRIPKSEDRGQAPSARPDDPDHRGELGHEPSGCEAPRKNVPQPCAVGCRYMPVAKSTSRSF